LHIINKRALQIRKRAVNLLRKMHYVNALQIRERALQIRKRALQIRERALTLLRQIYNVSALHMHKRAVQFRERAVQFRERALQLRDRALTPRDAAPTHRNTLQLTATHCKSLQLTATHCSSRCTPLTPWRWQAWRTRHDPRPRWRSTRALVYILHHTATHCNTLQHTATHCNTLQRTATHCYTHCNSHCTPSTPWRWQARRTRRDPRSSRSRQQRRRMPPVPQLGCPGDYGGDASGARSGRAVPLTRSQVLRWRTNSALNSRALLLSRMLSPCMSIL